jgi:hypothetical protein
MSHDVFISYATKRDTAVAKKVCDAIEAAGVTVWIAPRNIPPGQTWASAIIEAINNCKVVVLVFSSGANESQYIPLEISRAKSKNKSIIPFRIENVAPSGDLEFFLDLPQWLDAHEGPFDRHVSRLAEILRAKLGVKPPKIVKPAAGVGAPPAQPVAIAALAPKAAPPLRLYLTGGLAALAALGAAWTFSGTQTTPGDVPGPHSPPTPLQQQAALANCGKPGRVLTQDASLDENWEEGVSGKPIVLSASALIVQGRCVELVNVAGAPRGDPNAQKLQAFLAANGAAVGCRAVGAGKFHCEINRYDLSREVVARGWAQREIDGRPGGGSH